jgi:hypothetical protein
MVDFQQSWDEKDEKDSGTKPDKEDGRVYAL